MTTDPTPNRDPLEELASDFLEQLRRGESPSVEDFAASHPDLAAEIRDLFPALVAMEQAKADAEASTGGLASLGPAAPQRLGDFRIMRELGRGGMGVVYEAEQESLGRRVAIKVLPRQVLLDPKHLLRFKREAQVAAGLHHTNIVPIIGVGEQDGFHYYVMQLVHGVGLDRIIRALGRAGDTSAAEPADTAQARAEAIGRKLFGQPATAQHWRRAADIGLQVARALAYAHGKNAMHRDIKPANLLVDVRGTVWVTDFGLAKAARSDDVTQAGTVSGTLRYMAPEQFEGRTDERSDIYSLGITLYELLALRPAYADTGPSRLVHSITTSDPVDLRRQAPAVPRDLETIVQKAISREPRHRYATAAAMADDLERFLEDRPIAARHVTSAERLWRWCRRNRAVASLAAATLALIVAVAVVAMVGYVRTRNALRQEAAQRRRAEAVVGVAGEALDRVFSRLGSARVVQSSLSVGDTDQTSIQMVGQPAISTETAALLEEMLPFYDRLAEQTGDAPAVRRSAADARRRIGDIRQRLGQYDQAAAAYREAIELYGRLRAVQPHDQVLLTGMAEACNELGRALLLLGQRDQARQAHARALELLESVGPEATPQARFELARTHYFLGQRMQREPGAQPPPGPGNRPRPAGPLPPGPPGATGDRLPDNTPPGEPAAPPGRGPQADPEREVRNRHLDKAITLLDKLRTEQPSNPNVRYLLALCYRERVPPPGQGQLNVADKAIEILEELVRDYPQVADYRFDLSETYAAVETMGPGQRQRDRLPLMEERLRKALTLSRQLTQQHPNVPEYRASQARICHRLGEVLRQTRRLDEAEQCDRDALDLQVQLAREFPEVVTYQVWESALQNSLTDLLLRRGALAEARSTAEANIKRTEALLAAHPELWYLNALLADADRGLAAALRRSGEADLAAKAERQAEMHRSMLRPGDRAAGPRRPQDDAAPHALPQ